MEAQKQQLLEQVMVQEDLLLRTAAPNLRALENLKTVRDKFQESTDGDTELLNLPGQGCPGHAFLSTHTSTTDAYFHYLITAFSKLSTSM